MSDSQKKASSQRILAIKVGFVDTVFALSKICKKFGMLSGYDEQAIRKIVELSPNYVFCNQKRMGAGTPLWLGNWDWVIYEVTDADQALALARLGAKYVEGMDACRLHHELHR